MANWNTAYNWMMNKEDAARACAQVSDACPGGVSGPCFAISGVNSGAWPAEFAAIAALPQAQREPLVQQFYQNHFWNNWYAQLNSDDLCMRVFDFAVNGGSGSSVRCWRNATQRGWRLGSDDAERCQCGRPCGSGQRVPGEACGLLPIDCRRQPE
jgi:hypothetical protein